MSACKEHEAGRPTTDLRAQDQSSDVLCMECQVRRKEISDLAKMSALEDENRRLKRIVADQALHIDTLKIAASGSF